MSRRNAAAKREVLPDPRFSSVTLAKFINRMMLDGKKSIAERIVYGALDLVAEQMKHQVKKDETGDSGSSESGSGKLAPVDYLELALENLRPMVEVRSRRVGGATYQVPVEVRPERRDTLAMRWLVTAARQRSEKGMERRLAGEIIDAIGKRGAAYKKLDDVLRMAKANQAFVHFRWT